MVVSHETSHIIHKNKLYHYNFSDIVSIKHLNLMARIIYLLSNSQIQTIVIVNNDQRVSEIELLFN